MLACQMPLRPENSDRGTHSPLLQRPHTRRDLGDDLFDSALPVYEQVRYAPYPNGWHWIIPLPLMPLPPPVHLQDLQSWCRLTGTVPDAIGQLTAMKVLNLV